MSTDISPKWTCLAPSKAACAWPDCGCDPEATKVIAALVEQGWQAPMEGGMTNDISELVKKLRAHAGFIENGGCADHSMMDEPWLLREAADALQRSSEQADEALDRLMARTGGKLAQLHHYRDHDCQLDHARTIAEGRILQAQQMLAWINEEIEHREDQGLPHDHSYWIEGS